MNSVSRAFVADLEVRATSDGRTVGGIVVPWNSPARVSDGGPSYQEMFARGSLTKTLMERGDKVKFLSQHNSRTNPLGVAIPTSWRDDSAGQYGEFRVSKTQAGDEALELIRDGALDSFSVGFTPVKHEKRDGVTIRTEVRLNEVSVVTFPAYQDARILAVRDAFAAFDGDPETLEELRRMVAEALHLTPATTADEQPERSNDSDDEPASATPAAHLHSFRHLRRLAREKGIL